MCVCVWYNIIWIMANCAVIMEFGVSCSKSISQQSVLFYLRDNQEYINIFRASPNPFNKFLCKIQLNFLSDWSFQQTITHLWIKLQASFLHCFICLWQLQWTFIFFIYYYLPFALYMHFSQPRMYLFICGSTLASVSIV